MEENEFNLIEDFKQLMRRAMVYAEKAHKFVFDEKTDISLAISYLNVACSKFASAESLYYARYDVLERHEAESIFHLFEVFMTEFLTNARTDHSHQWTDIEFERLKDAFYYSAFAFENK